ncbi:3-phosphoshikimate 1-carboxyvinyltransferase [Burkholderia plantarii]|uniref:3-phosphoshikimate 1-carboxyvinyltransferase n=1 Tax=Burkholderia plantarii TaxID=41899 RepID=A0A0B6RQL1_BURPL|nr:3-phosphoshikimate 1-carboxyvinyltransferase [Burkholderia plantarii]AJK47632.1 3-phosphoshikimate 1-carboxyvinyltransferase AroA [Burkholderia plantarii]
MSEHPTLLQVEPITALHGRAVIPSSKPETQRAILAATLADGVSIIHNDLRCVETSAMKQACRALGATIDEHPGHLEIRGVGRALHLGQRVVDAIGSGLVFRTFAALTSFASAPAIITGDTILRSRVMKPLFDALAQLGARIECIGEAGKAPVVNWGGGLRGGRCTIPGNISSQFVTAVLFAAPLADQPVEIVVEGELLSASYIRQTLATLRHAGITVEANEPLSLIRVQPGAYRSAEYRIGGDYTSSSYLIGAAALFPGTFVLGNLDSESLQGERAIIEVVRALGIEVRFDDTRHELTLVNPHGRPTGDFEFDASDFPNIVPTLAAVGAFVDGTFRVVGGSITRLHKSPRIKAMVSELGKLGVDIKGLFKDGVYDGFEIRGNGTAYAGGVDLSSWGDHRIFMSLFVASLRSRQPNRLDGYRDVNCSFPDFFSQFEQLGARSHEVTPHPEQDDEPSLLQAV